MPPKGPEYSLQSQIAQLAHILGWETIAFRPLFTQRGFRTPGSGSMAKGWPDMTLVRSRDRRLIFAELKSDTAKTTPDQDRVLDVLRAIEHYPTPLDMALRQREPIAHPSIQVFVWRPRDWPQIEQVLR
jgi:hypothetical protein